ncbi:MAG: aminotransferase class I/II-fold pyridoxal phosphate-dependent enzyme, partial [Chloroflexota bacterium]
MTTEPAAPRVARAPDDFLSERIRSLQPSGIRRFFDMLAEMKDVISLTIGEPDFTTPEPITRAAIASLEAGETHYTANGGMVELREAIVADVERRYGLAYEPCTELIITVGASEAVDASLRAICDPGDEVIYHEPSFVAYPPCITLAGGVPVPIATGDETDFRMTAAQLEAAITPRTKALFLGYPNNPTGAVLDRDELEAIAAVIERHDLLVISDEIYERLVYGGHEHVPFSAIPGMRERTVLIGGFSKSYAMTGWRIGWVAAPEGLMSGIAKVHQYGIMCAPTMAQFAALEALRIGEPFVAEMHAEYDRRRQLTTRRFNEMGLLCFEPRGAFYCFPNIGRTGMDDETFAQQ